MPDIAQTLGVMDPFRTRHQTIFYHQASDGHYESHSVDVNSFELIMQQIQIGIIFIDFGYLDTDS